MIHAFHLSFNKGGSAGTILKITSGHFIRLLALSLAVYSLTMSAYGPHFAPKGSGGPLLKEGRRNHRYNLARRTELVMMKVASSCGRTLAGMPIPTHDADLASLPFGMSFHREQRSFVAFYSTGLPWHRYPNLACTE